MKTTEQLITEGVEYFKKTGKHLFEINHPGGKNEYKHVCLITKDGVDYQTNIQFRAENSEATVDMVKTTQWPVHKAEHSQAYFQRWVSGEYGKTKAIKQNKYLKGVLDEIKTNIINDTKELADYNNRLYIKYSPLVEKSGI